MKLNTAPARPPVIHAGLLAAAALSQAVLTGCESTDGGGGVHDSASYDPYYYGGYYGDPDRDYIHRPGAPPHVEHYGTRPLATPMAAPLMGGGGFRR